jgi:demethylspheroidene O-methyltransferase
MAVSEHFDLANPQDRARPGIRQKLRNWRNKLVADAGFQQKVARFPLTRRFARKQSEDLFRATTGFVQSQILFACVEIDLCDILMDGPLSAQSIAAKTSLPLVSVERLLPAARALGLIRPTREGEWSLDDTGAVISGNPGIRAMIRHHAMLYRDLSDPVALLRDPTRKTETADYWAYAGTRAGRDVSDQDAETYSALMRSSQDLVATEILDAYPLGRHRSVLDIGGGEGAFLAAAGQRHGNLALKVFDLPPVAARATEIMRDAGFGERFTAHGGNFFTDDLPGDSECITLVRVLCDHDDEPALNLLKNIRRSIHPDATLLIGEPMDRADAGGSLAAAYFGLYFLAMQSGSCRSADQIAALLRAAGFGSIKRVATRNPLFASVLTAKPESKV